MSEQPKRVETWAYTVPGGVVPCADFETAQQEAEIGNDEEFTSRVVRLTERRNDETIVGPLEMAVIEAAINHQKIADAFKAEDDEDILCALAKKSTAAQRTLEAAVRALREARQ